MWSGPRNISTAMMRSFGARADTVVVDEPLYAHYLAATGLEHPGREEILASQPVRWQEATEALLAPVPAAVFYQKHMTHHLLPQIERKWLAELTHAFLLRDPRDVLPSLDAKFARPTLADTGMAQQLEIFELVRKRTGRIPPVIDASDLLRDPEKLLRALCERLGIAFESSMLSWPAGRRETDGVWAKHWYHNVEKSTGFTAERMRHAELDEHLRGLHEECLPYYKALHVHRLRI